MTLGLWLLKMAQSSLDDRRVTEEVGHKGVVEDSYVMLQSSVLTKVDVSVFPLYEQNDSITSPNASMSNKPSDLSSSAYNSFSNANSEGNKSVASYSDRFSAYMTQGLLALKIIERK